MFYNISNNVFVRSDVLFNLFISETEISSYLVRLRCSCLHQGGDERRRRMFCMPQQVACARQASRQRVLLSVCYPLPLSNTADTPARNVI